MPNYYSVIKNPMDLGTIKSEPRGAARWAVPCCPAAASAALGRRSRNAALLPGVRLQQQCHTCVAAGCCHAAAHASPSSWLCHLQPRLSSGDTPPCMSSATTCASPSTTAAFSTHQVGANVRIRGAVGHPCGRCSPRCGSCRLRPHCLGVRLTSWLNLGLAVGPACRQPRARHWRPGQRALREEVADVGHRVPLGGACQAVPAGRCGACPLAAAVLAGPPIHPNPPLSSHASQAHSASAPLGAACSCFSWPPACLLAVDIGSSAFSQSNTRQQVLFIHGRLTRRGAAAARPPALQAAEAESKSLPDKLQEVTAELQELTRKVGFPLAAGCVPPQTGCWWLSLPEARPAHYREADSTG